MIPVIINRSGISDKIKVNQVTKEQREILMDFAKASGEEFDIGKRRKFF